MHPITHAEGETVSEGAVSSSLANNGSSIWGEKQSGTLFSSMAEGVAVHRMVFDVDGKPVDYEIVEVNPAFEKHTGIDASQANGRLARELYGTPEAPFIDIYAEVARTGEPCVFDTYHAPLGRQFSVSVFSPRKDWFVTVFSDITRLALMHAEIGRLNRIYAVLSQVNQAVLRVRSNEELFVQVCNIAIEFGEFKLAWIGWVDPETQQVKCLASSGETGYLEGITVYADDRPEGRGPAGTSIRTANTYVSGDFDLDPNIAPWREAARRHGLFDCISLPIYKDGRIGGALLVYAAEKNFFQAKEIKLFEEVAGDISFALNHLEQDARRREAEREKAQSISILRATLESTADGILAVDLDGRVVECNDQFLRMWHFPTEIDPAGNLQSPVRSGTSSYSRNFISRQFNDPEGFLARVDELYARPGESGFDVLRCKDGRVIERYSIPQKVNGRAVGRVWSFSDVTERVQAEESLRKSEAKYHSLIDHLHCGVVVHGPDTRILMGNPEASRLLGLSEEQMQGKAALDPAWSFVHEDGTRVLLEEYPISRVLTTGEPLNGLVLGICHGVGAKIVWVLVNAYPEFDERRRLRQVVVTFVDITGRKRAEEALQESEEKFRSLFTSSRDATMLLGEDRFFDCNGAALRLFGCSAKEELALKGFVELSPAVQPGGRDSAAAARERLEAVYATGSQFFEWEFRRPDGIVFPAEVLASRFELHGRPAMQVVVRDISWRRAAEGQLRQLSCAVEQSPSSVVITDTEGCVEYVNPKFTSVTGYSLEEIVGRKPNILKSGLTTPEVYSELWRTILAGKEWRGELHNRKKNGELFWESASICPITDEAGVITHYLAVKEDITERKLMTERFLRAQRMESIGSLAGGVAHDLNNILAPIMMSASMLQEELPPETARQFITTIGEAAERGASIVRQLLTFARGVEGERTAFEPKLLLEQLGRIVRETFPRAIAFVAPPVAELWNLTGDLTQLYQVLLNLCVNARDAMPDGGTLTLSAENTEVDETFAILSPDAHPGRHVRFKVADTGTGISTDIVAKIFDPFFTTKEQGKGTGLGLSTALGIVRSHRGFMLVSSEPGKGSVFEVFVPATPEAILLPSDPRPCQPPTGNDETILVVDDEPEILRTTEVVLTCNGYRVLAASNGQEALAIYLANAETIALVLTDLIMPVMGGIQLIRAIKLLDPSLPVIAASGHGDDAYQNDLLPLGVRLFLPKPFDVARILTTLHEALHP